MMAWRVACLPAKLQIARSDLGSNPIMDTLFRTKSLPYDEMPNGLGTGRKT